ncbi:MAG: sulfurtransferase-like selenium metabolism protein YedF [bacterium]|nr:sulfurtransferase-like selenium metabolism protein YedF [bacterium]
MSRSVIFIAGDALGRGDDELGAALLLSALKNLPKAAGDPPSHLLFMNAGVNLCCEGSAALADLRSLQDAGAELLCCGTCLDWFELREKLAVGRASNMVEILGVQNAAARVIRL